MDADVRCLRSLASSFRAVNLGDLLCSSVEGRGNCLHTSLVHGHLLTEPSVNCQPLTTSIMQGYEPFQVTLVLSLTVLTAVSKTIGMLQKLPGSCFFISLKIEKIESSRQVL